MDDAELQVLKERAPTLAALYATSRDAIARAADLGALEQVRVATLGRKSPLTELLRSISTAPAEQRPLLGKGGNMVRRELEALIEAREVELKRAAISASLEHERLDVTLPGQPFPVGTGREPFGITAADALVRLVAQPRQVYGRRIEVQH